MSDAQTSASMPAEVDATISRLASNKHVQGVLIMTRSDGIVLRSAGQLFEASYKLDDTLSSEPDVRGEARPRDQPTSSTGNGAAPVKSLAHGYAQAVLGILNSASVEVGALPDSGDVKFMRIRLNKYELMITPDPEFVLIVVQLPS